MLPVWLTDTVTSDLPRALHYTQLWGLRGVELRTVGDANDRVPFVNEKQIRQHMETTDMLIASVVPSVFEGPVSDRIAWMNDLAQFDETLRFCNRIGCPRIVLSAFAGERDADYGAMADAFRRAGEKAERHDVQIAVLNGPSTSCPRGVDLAALLEQTDHPSVHAAWNPAGALRAGETPANGLAALYGRVSLVRVSDGFVQDGHWVDTPLGEGDVGWAHQLAELHAQDFLGPLSLEVYQEPRPKHGLRDSTTLIRLIRETAREGARE